MPLTCDHPMHPVVDTAYTDGGVIGMNPSQDGGSWAFRYVAGGVPTWEQAGVVLLSELPPSMPYVSCNLTEFLAILLAVEGLPGDSPVEVCSDSINAIDAFRYPDRKNWVPAHLWQRRVAEMARLDGRIGFKLLGGHPTKIELAQGFKDRNGLPVSEHNQWCDEAATQAIADYRHAQLSEEKRCLIASMKPGRKRKPPVRPALCENPRPRSTTPSGPSPPTPPVSDYPSDWYL
jgi:hypothetical protein